MQNVNEDKKLKSAIKKFGKISLSPIHLTISFLWIGVQPLQDIDEVNMFKDDNTVIHFKRPLSKYYYISRRCLSAFCEWYGWCDWLTFDAFV